MNIKTKSTLEKFEKCLIFKNYSKRTIEIYLHYAGKLLLDFDKDVYHISQKEVVEYLTNKKYSSISQQNQIINAVKLLYKYVVNSKIKLLNLERPRSEKKLPRVIDKDFLLDKISKIDNLKHKSIIVLAYSVGLRVSEVINLKISDIDSKRMIITIRQSKGRKDRIVPLTETALKILREYYIYYKPKEYLFNGQLSLNYSSTSCNQIVKKYLGEDYHFHILRHSTFSNLTDQNVDIRVIQALAGHNSPKTTQIYCHVSKQRLNNLPLAI